MSLAALSPKPAADEAACPGTRLDLVLLGPGLVGRRFLIQLQRQQARLAPRGIELRLCAVANSRRMLVDATGIDPLEAEVALAERGEPLDRARLLALAGSGAPIVLVDCTGAEAVAGAYEAFAEAGFHLVGASKLLNAGPLPRYRRLRKTLTERGLRFNYETNVGAGLPVIGTLRDLLAGGDSVDRIEGILSGSLSFIFGLLEEGTPFSEAVRLARDAGFTEPDPRDDLSGLDVARKALILHRELGGTLELEGVVVEGALPKGFDATGEVKAFLENIKALNAPFQAHLERLKSQGKVLRFAATITPDGCKVGLVEVDRSHPLHAIKGGENALSFASEAYNPCPLVVRGYGAGAMVTAAGVLADVVRLLPH
jgi:aspartokinase/homoserine dehydrogenase 1